MAVRSLLTIAVAAGLALGAPAAAGAAEPPAPAGSNDFSCKPTAAHPFPIVLVHGTAENQFNNWGALSPALKANGYCVFSLNYGATQYSSVSGVYGLGEISNSAQQLGAFVARVRSATGAAKVSLVGHSQGGMMPRYYLKFLGGASEVDDLVGLSPSNHGTSQALPPPANQFCPACDQQKAGSAFLTNLNAGDETPGDVSYTQVVTRTDEVVVPYTSGYLSGPNTTNVTLQDRCPADPVEHLGISYDPAAIQWALNALGRGGPADPAFQPTC
jgi:triacylglycerol esterase/lipase EstA (alpha/beta hydrolase family)